MREQFRSAFSSYLVLIIAIGSLDNKSNLITGEPEHGPDGEDRGDGDHGSDQGPDSGHHLCAGGRQGGGERLPPGAVGPEGALLGNVEGEQQSQMAALTITLLMW